MDTWDSGSRSDSSLGSHYDNWPKDQSRAAFCLGFDMSCRMTENENSHGCAVSHNISRITIGTTPQVSKQIVVKMMITEKEVCAL